PGGTYASMVRRYVRRLRELRSQHRHLGALRATLCRSHRRRSASARVIARPAILSALRYRDFRLLWIGLLISNLGTWMQFTATGYFIAAAAGSPHRAALELGILGAARAMPVLLLS